MNHLENQKNEKKSKVVRVANQNLNVHVSHLNADFSFKEKGLKESIEAFYKKHAEVSKK